MSPGFDDSIFDGDSLHEECGVFAVFQPEGTVAPLAYLGLHALQHRGQEAAGIATAYMGQITVTKEVGLVSEVFDQRTLNALPGDMAIAHTRYSTTGRSEWSNAQPIFRGVNGVGFALAHNGNLTNTAALVEEADVLPGMAGSDTDVAAELISKALQQHDAPGDGLQSLVNACRTVMPMLEGAYSMVMLHPDAVIAARDPRGFRPLCLGKLGDGWVVASETTALDIVGATYERDIDEGELVVITRSGIESIRLTPIEDIEPHLCIFEYVYFARPDSLLLGRGVHSARVRMGRELAREAPAVGDLVMGVPESGLAAAEGYALESGIAYGQGLVKNRYIGRTFIAPDQEKRRVGVRMKLNPLRENIAGKRLIVVDDSIVRGTTTRAMVEMLRNAGADEIHMRISSPPYRHPCYFGLDVGSEDELLATGRSVDEIAAHLGVDSLAYLSLGGLQAAIDNGEKGYCDACLTGDYPIEIPVEIGKHVLEAPRG